MLRAFTSVSNDGVMLEPQFITKIYDPKTGKQPYGEKKKRQAILFQPMQQKQTRQYMVTVGTDPNYGTLYSASLGGPVIKVGNQSVAVKSGTAQIASGDGSGYLSGSNDYIYSVVAMVPSDNPDFLMYVTLQQPESFSVSFWQDVVNPVLEEATLMKDTLLAPIETPGRSTD